MTITERSGICIVTVTRPDRANALRRQTIRELGAALRRIESRATDTTRGVVITGGEGRFSAGADLAALTGTIDDLGFDDELETLTDQIVRSPVPVVAAVEGACFGAAIDLAWSCDAVVVSRTARLGLPATRLGILYNPSSLARLRARLGSAALRRLLVLGEELSGADLATVTAAVLVDEGTAVASAVALIDRSGPVRAATAATKALLASLDTEHFRASEWQEQRCALLRSPERIRALNRAQMAVQPPST